MDTLYCQYCGARIEHPRKSTQRYCSQQCAALGIRAERENASEEERRPVLKICKRCHAEFRAGNATAKYCDTCKRLAYLEKHREWANRRSAARLAAKQAAATAEAEPAPAPAVTADNCGPYTPPEVCPRYRIRNPGEYCGRHDSCNGCSACGVTFSGINGVFHVRDIS